VHGREHDTPEIAPELHVDVAEADGLACENDGHGLSGAEGKLAQYRVDRGGRISRREAG